MILMTTYNVSPRDVVGLPAWASTARFDIAAKAPGNVSRDEIMAMVKTLLADRFSLRTHMAERTQTTTVLTVKNVGELGRGLRRSFECDSASAPDPSRPIPKDREERLQRCGGVAYTTVRDGVVHFQAHGVPFGSFLTMVGARAATGGFTDQTGLSGTFDVDIEFATTPAASADATAPVSTPPLPIVMEDQLGLKFVKRDLPIPTLVIDHVVMPEFD